MAFDPDVAHVRLEAVRIAMAATSSGVSLGEKTVLQHARTIAAFAEGTEEGTEE